MQSKNESAELGPQLLAFVRAGFIAQATTMADWCREYGITQQNARMALLGGWRGPKARVLIAKITKAAGVEAPREVA